MKITKSQLKRIIKEEIELALSEEIHDLKRKVHGDERSEKMISDEKTKQLKNIQNSLIALGGENRKEAIDQLVVKLVSSLISTGDSRLKSYVPNVKQLRTTRPGSEEYFDELSDIGGAISKIIKQKKLD